MPTQDITWIVPEGGGGREFLVSVSNPRNIMLTHRLSQPSTNVHKAVYTEGVNEGRGTTKENRRRSGISCFFLVVCTLFHLSPPAFVLYLLTPSLVPSSLVEGSSVRETKLLLVALRLTFKLSRRRWLEK